MTDPKIGEILEHRSTGVFFEVKKVTPNWVILFSRDLPRQIMTGKENFDYLFARVSPLQSLARK